MISDCLTTRIRLVQIDDSSLTEQFGEEAFFLVTEVFQIALRSRLVGMAGVNHIIANTPIRQAAEITVVNPQISHQFAGRAVLGFLLRIIGVDGIELQTFRLAVVEGFLQQFAFTHCPQNDLVMVFVLQFFEGLNGKRNGFAYFRVLLISRFVVT